MSLAFGVPYRSLRLCPRLSLHPLQRTQQCRKGFGKIECVVKKFHNIFSVLKFSFLVCFNVFFHSGVLIVLEARCLHEGPHSHGHTAANQLHGHMVSLRAERSHHNPKAHYTVQWCCHLKQAPPSSWPLVPGTAACDSFNDKMRENKPLFIFGVFCFVHTWSLSEIL